MPVLAKDTTKRSHPRPFIIKCGSVPPIVAGTEQRHLACCRLLHGVTDERVHAPQVGIERGVAVDVRLVVKVAVGIKQEELVHVVVVAGIVPPPCHIASEPSAHLGGIVTVGDGPHRASSDVNVYLRRCAAQRLEELLCLGLAHPRIGIELRHVMEGLHGVGRVRLFGVPLLVDELLQPCETVGSEPEHRFVIGHAYIIDEDPELTHAELVHVGILRHDLVEHVGLCSIGESLSRVDRPDEVYLALMCHVSDRAQHVLRKIADLPFFLRDGCRIRLFPETGVIRITFGSIHIGIHLIARHEPEEVFRRLLAVGHAVITFDDTPVLRVGVIVDAHLPQLIFLSVKHLLQRGQAAEHGVGILTEHDYLSVAVLARRNGDGMAVILGLSKNVTRERQSCRRLVRGIAGAIDAYEDGHASTDRFLSHHGRYAVLLQDALSPVHSVGVAAFARYQRGRGGGRHGAFFRHLLLGNGPNVIGTGVVAGHDFSRKQQKQKKAHCRFGRRYHAVSPGSHCVS